MTVYRVGELYNPNIREWREATQFNFRGGQFELLLFYDNPSLAETEAITRRPARFAAWATDDAQVIAFLHRFATDADWSDSPYTIHLVPERERLPLPLMSDDTRILLSVILVNAANGIIRGIRAVTLSPNLSRYIVGAIERQSALMWNEREYDATLARVQQQHRPRDLARLGARNEEL